MAETISELKLCIKFLTANTDRLLEANKIVMSLEQDVFHEKWKVRYLTKRLKTIDPHGAVTAEELDAEIKGDMN